MEKNKLVFYEKKSKWPTKKAHFPALQILNIFWGKFMVKRNDHAKKLTLITGIQNGIKRGALYVVFPVIVTVIVLLQCLTCTFGQN